MHISYRGIVDRRSTDNDGLRYGFTTWSLQTISSWPEHKSAIEEIEQAKCHFPVSQYRLVDKFRSDDVEEMLVGVPNPDLFGCVLIWAYPHLSGGFTIEVILGTECEFPAELEDSLRSEHLGIEATFEVKFSLYERNEYISRPVTFSQFETGRKVLVPGVPSFSLIRRHVP